MRPSKPRNRLHSTTSKLSIRKTRKFRNCRTSSISRHQSRDRNFWKHSRQEHPSVKTSQLCHHSRRRTPLLEATTQVLWLQRIHQSQTTTQLVALPRWRSKSSSSRKSYDLQMKPLLSWSTRMKRNQTIRKSWVQRRLMSRVRAPSANSRQVRRNLSASWNDLRCMSLSNCLRRCYSWR